MRLIATAVLLGAAASAQTLANLEQRYQFVSDARFTSYYQRLADQIAKPARLAVPIQLRVLEYKWPKAITSPGGLVLISTGLIDLAHTRSAMAAIFAHTIAHIQLGGISVPFSGAIPLVFVGGEDGLCIRFAGARLIPQQFRPAIRAREHEADRLALQYLEAAGFDPGALAQFFEHLPAPY